ncbi:hypothetical protein BCR34DRAFT_615989 [Clohesyomyces aquaticus]|uniref:Putative lipoate-protein ligase A n=1 Tax=Clohesyomyces aquaticus TaxID=1231657 RepID=A0A1Y1ZGL4_9PLEO|nr:hypothetical protein BCR34DRAFT_615989 [Clohesyomyces aquaticus]
MAPSRGLLHTLNAFLRSVRHKPPRRKYSTFSETLSNPANKAQTYISRSTDPYLNLSIEDHILRTSSPSSSILFLYTNRPSIIIGRNQNPWLEVNLRILRPNTDNDTVAPETNIGNVDLVRRRSGGGTVFHDLGNVNWSITSPRLSFTRDKHAEMVVRALRKLGVSRARVNSRHDIVLDQGPRQSHRDPDPEDMHRTPYTSSTLFEGSGGSGGDDGGGIVHARKVSGSAYKLTRHRALHHGTALLNSPNLEFLGSYLRSPAKSFIEAKGVESVSSPVANLGIGNGVFEKAVCGEFVAMYGDGNGDGEGNLEPKIVDNSYLHIPSVKKGYDELRTADWTYTQTPHFTFSLWVMEYRIQLSIRHGTVESVDFFGPGTAMLLAMPESRANDLGLHELRMELLGRKLQDIGGSEWEALAVGMSALRVFMAKKVGGLLGVPGVEGFEEEVDDR